MPIIINKYFKLNLSFEDVKEYITDITSSVEVVTENKIAMFEFQCRGGKFIRLFVDEKTKHYCYSSYNNEDEVTFLNELGDELVKLITKKDFTSKLYEDFFNEIEKYITTAEFAKKTPKEEQSEKCSKWIDDTYKKLVDRTTSEFINKFNKDSTIHFQQSSSTTVTILNSITWVDMKFNFNKEVSSLDVDNILTLVYNAFNKTPESNSQELCGYVATKMILSHGDYISTDIEYRFNAINEMHAKKLVALNLPTVYNWDINIISKKAFSKVHF